MLTVFYICICKNSFQFGLPVCFLKTGMRPMNGNFLPVIAIVVFFVAFDLSVTFLSDFVSFFSMRRSRDFDLEREERE